MRSKKDIILYRGRQEGKKFIAYIDCALNGKEKMMADYKTGATVRLNSYGEVIYYDYIPEPNMKAKMFIHKWMKENNSKPT